MILEQLQAQKLLHFFEELCAIPHGSGNTKMISDYCVNFAKERGLEYYQDTLNNVIIIKPAARGYELADAVMLQGHLDMVCAKAPGTDIDFMKDGLSLATDGEYIYAKGTSLGGDDGIAIAAALAILDSDDIPHPRLEAVFTVDEEIGLLGAAGLDTGPLKAVSMINLDSEEEGIFTVGCAGGVRADCHIPVERERLSMASLELSVSGLQGGHSGVEIDKRRGNSNILMGRLLQALAEKFPVRIVELSGGSFDNVIPRETAALIALEEHCIAAALEAVRSTECILKNELSAADPELCISATVKECAELSCLSIGSSTLIIDALSIFPNSVQEMSMDIPGLVQTSLNLGILELREHEMHACFCIRSSLTSQKKLQKTRLECICRRLGGSVEFRGDYPAWEYRQNSPLRELMVKVYRELYNKDPQVLTIHAGLECGLLTEKMPWLDCVSCGPNMVDIHTCREKLEIASVVRVWNFLLEVLRQMR